MMPGVNLVFGSGSFLVLPIILAPSIYPTLIITPLLFTIAYILAMWQRYLKDLQPVTTGVRQAFGTMNAGLTAAIEGIRNRQSCRSGRGRGQPFLCSMLARCALRQSIWGGLRRNFCRCCCSGSPKAAGLWHAISLFQQGTLRLGQVVEYVGLLQLFGFPSLPHSLPIRRFLRGWRGHGAFWS